jgi:hypothetical protein
VSDIADDDAPAGRRRNAHPEHGLQVMVNKFVRAHVPYPHFFCSIDRRAATSKFDHAREKAAGFVAGCPDTILVCPGFALIAVELKAPGKRPTARQFEVGEAIKRSGHIWAWADSVESYAALLHGWGVPLIGRWDIAAQGHDATLAAAAIRREEAKTGKPSRKRVFAQRKAGPRFPWPARAVG